MLYFHLPRFGVCLAFSTRIMKLAVARVPLNVYRRPPKFLLTALHITIFYASGRSWTYHQRWYTRGVSPSRNTYAVCYPTVSRDSPIHLIRRQVPTIITHHLTNILMETYSEIRTQLMDRGLFSTCIWRWQGKKIRSWPKTGKRTLTGF